MILNTLSLVNFKNLQSETFHFDPKVNCLVGPNGVGKTNVLDAIYLLAFGKSYFNPMASQNISHGMDFYVVEGDFNKEGKPEKIVCSLKKGNKKVIKRNGKAYDKLSDHIGFLPLVIISPYDRDLITEGSETRRKFIDGVISQSDKTYLEQLLRYHHTLGQRNALLKYFAANHTFDPLTLQVYDDQLVSSARVIHQKRREFLDVFIPIFREHYRSISGQAEEVSLTYDSRLNDKPLEELLKDRLQKDRLLQYTTAGVHKDDLNLEIQGYPVKKFGSQGQQKSFLIALKLAQFDFIRQQSGDTPILLLDDIFDKLDETRVSRLVSLVDQAYFGQIFISDTHPDRTEQVVKATHQTYAMFELGKKTINDTP